MFTRKPLIQEYRYYDFDSECNLIKRNPIYTYWWDDVPNFGDWIGPYLLGQIYGRPVVNVKGNIHSNVLFSVGSVIEHIGGNYPNAKVWGSGLIQPLHKKRAKKLNQFLSHVYAVRGKKTEQELSSKTDISVPKVYGDPALLMPSFYTPKVNPLLTKNVSICPHFSHFEYFTNLQNSERIKVIDVRKSLLSVINEIANSSVCISTSLHGIIIAEAYEVPWVWLKVSEKVLDGDDFKFEDFFTTIHGGELINSVVVKKEEITEEYFLNLARLGRVYSKKFSDSHLLDALQF